MFIWDLDRTLVCFSEVDGSMIMLRYLHAVGHIENKFTDRESSQTPVNLSSMFHKGQMIHMHETGEKW